MAPFRLLKYGLREDTLPSKVLIRGGGVAALCCEHLLRRAGLHPIVETVDRPNVPAIMLTESTQKLLSDVFEGEDLFQGASRIRNRVVAWGLNSAPLVVPHSAIVVSERELLDRIRRHLAPGERDEGAEIDWTIFTSRPLPAPTVDHHFGARMAIAAAVKLKTTSDAETCWVESIEQGWLFLLPGGAGSAWLLSVGGRPESLLAVSRVVAEQIAEIGGSGGEFPCEPRITDPLCDSGWLACGTAVLGFDPLCGDGVGHAAREAILGSAVVRAVADGEDTEPVLAHYRTRLIAGMGRHLAVCREFYEAGRCGEWWDRELESTRRGLEWCARRIDNTSGFRYRLSGFALEAIT